MSTIAGPVGVYMPTAARWPRRLVVSVARGPSRPDSVHAVVWIPAGNRMDHRHRSWI